MMLKDGKDFSLVGGGDVVMEVWWFGWWAPRSAPGPHPNPLPPSGRGDDRSG